MHGLFEAGLKSMTKTQPSVTLNRRSALTLGLGAGAMLVSPRAFAQQGARRSGPTEVTVDEGNLRPRPIAIPEFFGDDPKFGADIANIVAADLERSGLFRPLDRGAFIERVGDLNQTPRFNDWKAIGAEALVVGRTSRSPDGRLTADFRLWDTILGRAIDGKSVAIPAQNWRRLGHIIADRVYEMLTLERGYFDTQIVFIDETGPKDRRLKRLAIMDQDGANVRLLSQGRELVLTPRFSPTRQEITYTRYDQQAATSRVFVMNLDSGQAELVADMRGQIFGPRFTPDGQRIVMSISEQGATNLFEMDLRSKQIRRLSQGNSIDTGPCYAPDGRQIVFESDRDGSQQLYVMGSGGGGARRISGGEGRYSTPVWSPRGDYIAFTKQAGGQFKIGVMKTDGSGERILSDGYHNEGPTWAPNGRVVMFFRESQGAQGGPKLFSVDLTGYNERVVPTPAFGSDPAWSPLRT
jgi:TolB protein